MRESEGSSGEAGQSNAARSDGRRTAVGTLVPMDGFDRRMAALREDAAPRRIAFALAVVVGLAAAAIHWLGLVAGSALVGITRQSLPRAVAAGVGFGVVVVVLFLATTPGSPIVAIDRTPTLSALSIVVALLAPAWGALVRGVA